MMFSMKKREEKTHKKPSYLMNRPPPPPVRSNPLAWKLLGPAYMSHLAEIFRVPL